MQIGFKRIFVIGLRQCNRSRLSRNRLNTMLTELNSQRDLRLIQAIDRRGFDAHLDPINMINSPALFFDNAALLRECLRLLGEHIRCCHAKDIRLGEGVTVQFDEVRPGLGSLDYATFLRELNKLDADIPVLLEHLPDAEEYRQAAAHIRSVAAQEGISL
jgi:sugar phosphate isomerase/epimerase